MIHRLANAAAFVLVMVAATVLQAAAQAQQPRIGIVVMHGKGGSPTGLVRELAASLEAKGCLVANPDMPWSARRGYDADVAAAEREVSAALDGLRARGAGRVFVAGHSQGGVFALHLAGRLAMDGVIAIAPGGNVANALFREKLGESVDRARRLLAEGKGNDKAEFLDFEGAKGTFSVRATAADYLSWFDPDGAMNQSRAMKSVNPKVPVLFIAPTGDYPGLRKVKQAMFDALPRNPLTRLAEPASDHVRAPSASVDEIVNWTAEVAKSTSTAAAQADQGSGGR